MSKWLIVLRVICSMIAGAVMLAMAVYVWVWFAMRDAMN